MQCPSDRSLLRRVPDGLPLVLYLPRVEAWAFGAVQRDAAASELSAGSIAVEGQMQRQGPAESTPLRCWAQCSLIHNPF